MTGAAAIGLSFTETRRVFAALSFAAERRRDRRRPGGTAGLDHPIALAEALVSIGGVIDPVVLSAALLHDIIEETETSAQELLERFGREVADVVLDVSDDLGLDREVRRRLQIVQAPQLSRRAKLVRLADLLASLTDLAERPPADWPAARRRAYADWAAAVAEGLRGSNLGLETALDRVLQRLA